VNTPKYFLTGIRARSHDWISVFLPGNHKVNYDKGNDAVLSVNSKAIVEGVIKGQKLEDTAGHSTKCCQDTAKKFTRNSAIGHPLVLRIIVAEAASPKVEHEDKRRSKRSMEIIGSPRNPEKLSKITIFPFAQLRP